MGMVSTSPLVSLYLSIHFYYSFIVFVFTFTDLYVFFVFFVFKEMFSTTKDFLSVFK